MSTLFSIIGMALVLTASPQQAHAAESTSFKLYNTNPNYASGGPKDSDSFQMNEDGATFVAQPTTSTNYQIVTAPPVSSSSSSSSTSSSEESADTGGGGGGGGGGHRGNETEVGRPRFPGSVTEPDFPSAPDPEPEPEPEPEPVESPVVPESKPEPELPMPPVLQIPITLLPGTPSKQPQFFDTVDAPWCACDCELKAAALPPVLGIRITIAILFMALSYLLGRFHTRLTEVITIKQPKKKSRSKKQSKQK